MEVLPGDLLRSDVQALLDEHLRDMRISTPPESIHALDLSGLQRPEIAFWTVWSDGELMGCGALKEIGPDHGEVKSMRTANAHRRKGVARAMLNHILGVAKSRGYQRVSLETGSQGAFEPARRLYESFGFDYCMPFDGYTQDPNSVFMTKSLQL
jgi:putative acetyltransferase